MWNQNLGKLLYSPDEQKILPSELILFRMNKKCYQKFVHPDFSPDGPYSVCPINSGWYVRYRGGPFVVSVRRVRLKGLLPLTVEYLQSTGAEYSYGAMAPLCNFLPPWPFVLYSVHA